MEGIAQINMGDPEEADLVIQMMNGRFFGQRKLTAEPWDGKTKFKYAINFRLWPSDFINICCVFFLLQNLRDRNRDQ